MWHVNRGDGAGAVLQPTLQCELAPRVPLIGVWVQSRVAFSIAEMNLWKVPTHPSAQSQKPGGSEPLEMNCDLQKKGQVTNVSGPAN